MGTKKTLCLIVMALLSLSGSLPAAATDHETAHDPPLAVDNSLLPSAPTNLVAEPGDGSATLRWDNPNNTPVDGWQYRQNAGDWQEMPDDDAAIDEYIVMGLTNGATYTFEVRTHNAAGWGPASNAQAGVQRGGIDRL